MSSARVARALFSAHTDSLDDYVVSQRVDRKAADDIKDSVVDLSQQEQLRLQMALYRRTKALQMLSNVLRKTSDTSKNMIQNMK